MLKKPRNLLLLICTLFLRAFFSTASDLVQSERYRLYEGRESKSRWIQITAIMMKSRPGDYPYLTKDLINNLLHSTNQYWNDWIRRSMYTGSWKEAVNRSTLVLKLLIYEPAGEVIASPTFSLPEYLGGGRNWLAFTREANAYMEFIFERLRNKNPDGSIQIMYTIHGGKDLEVIELTHLDSHKGSRPVRIGNGAADHLQLDIYGELLVNLWLLVRDLYSQLKLRQIFNQRRFKSGLSGKSVIRKGTLLSCCGLRIADKRSPPCPRRNEWLAARDELYEEIMNKTWNKELQAFGQSYEENDIMDSAILIMHWFMSTLHRVLRTPERGGLTSNNLVFRYDVNKASDDVGGEEGTFCLCTLWCVEALTRAGVYDKSLLRKAVAMFERYWSTLAGWAMPFKDLHELLHVTGKLATLGSWPFGEYLLVEYISAMSGGSYKQPHLYNSFKLFSHILPLRQAFGITFKATTYLDGPTLMVKEKADRELQGCVPAFRAFGA
ncbi:Six-hairpin glycosidase [Dendrothele bispora CBS 962.96]|uniref:Six-hairpin glycosidase n=1 Tax=Dendrothele bispora (strain CBS 962.96) TaxID=1314807 RepID=A0A4S8MKZ9_DENBC|nr:Six-hairpin glycosidase [Dendrothele bispora CBS 962.96]